MQDKDEYIGSLLLSLFLMQGEVDRLNGTLDLARKGELVYINNPQIEKLKAENERLRQELTTYGATSICEVCSDKANKLADKYLGCLQEIKAIAEELLEKGLEPQSVEHQLRLKGKRELASIILDLITKAEEE